MARVASNDCVASIARAFEQSFACSPCCAARPSAKAPVCTKKEAVSCATTRVKQVWKPKGACALLASPKSRACALPASPKVCAIQLEANLTETWTNSCENFKSLSQNKNGDPGLACPASCLSLFLKLSNAKQPPCLRYAGGGHFQAFVVSRQSLSAFYN